MTLLDQHPRSVYAALGLVFLIFGAYALRSKKAELPLHFWSLTVSKEEQPFGYCVDCDVSLSVSRYLLI